MNRDMTLAMLTLLISAIGIIALIFITSAPAATICLTKKEARHLWPRQHIYWYSKDRCWSNRRGQPRGLKLEPVRKYRDPLFPIHAEEPNEIDLLADKPPVEDVIEARPFGIWEERIGGAFHD